MWLVATATWRYALWMESQGKHSTWVFIGEFPHQTLCWHLKCIFLPVKTLIIRWGYPIKVQNCAKWGNKTQLGWIFLQTKYMSPLLSSLSFFVLLSIPYHQLFSFSCFWGLSNSLSQNSELSELSYSHLNVWNWCSQKYVTCPKLHG